MFWFKSKERILQELTQTIRLNPKKGTISPRVNFDRRSGINITVTDPDLIKILDSKPWDIGQGDE